MKYYIILLITFCYLTGCSIIEDHVVQQAFKGLQQQTERYSPILKDCTPIFEKHTLTSFNGRRDKYFVGYCPEHKEAAWHWDYYIIVITNDSVIKKTTDIDFIRSWEDSDVYYVALVGADKKGWAREFYSILYNSTSGKSLTVSHNSLYRNEIDSLVEKFFLKEKK